MTRRLSKVPEYQCTDWTVRCRLIPSRAVKENPALCYYTRPSGGVSSVMISPFTRCQQGYIQEGAVPLIENSAPVPAGESRPVSCVAAMTQGGHFCTLVPYLLPETSPLELDSFGP